MSRQNEIDTAFGDAVYEAWRAGLNPDAVDYDRISERVYEGYDRHEAVQAEVRHIQRQHQLRMEMMK